MLDAELAILSIVAEAPRAGRTGRDVEYIIDERNMRFWTLIGIESIYYVLEKLEQQGLIRNVDEIPPHDKHWRVYRITSAGIGVLQTAVTDLLSAYRYLPGRFDIGLVNIPVLRTDQVRRALLSYRDSLAGRAEAIHKQLNHLRQQSTPFYIVSMFEHQQAILDAEIKWFDQWFPLWEVQAPEDHEPTTPSATPIPRMEQVVLPHDPDSVHKLPTRKHAKVLLEEPIDLPPPPQKRSKQDETRASQQTPRRVFPQDRKP